MTALNNDNSIKEARELDFQVVQRVAAQASLEEIYLIDAEIRSDPVHRDGRGATLQLGFGSEIRPQQTVEELAVLCNFLLAAVKEGETENFSLEIKATFTVNYKIPSLDTFSAEELEMFARINPIYNAWPYWREFVQSTTTRMGFPPLTIPLFKISKPSADAKRPGLEPSPKKRKKAAA